MYISDSAGADGIYSMALGHKIPVERKAANVTCLKRGKIKLLVVPLVGKLVKGFVYDQFIPCTRHLSCSQMTG